MKKHQIEFISYSGKYPCLCQGVLQIKIDGEIYKFGHEPENYDFKTNSYSDENYNAFWQSGGLILNNRTQLYTTKNDWILSDRINHNYPKKIKKILNELLNVFKQHVQNGCCGGCVI